MASNNSSEALVVEATEIHFPFAMLGFTAAMAFVLAVIGSLGNVLTIVALWMCKKLHNTATYFVLNLALVEFLFCLIILPMSGAQYAYLQYNLMSLLSDRECVFFATTRYTLTQAEIQTILAIGLTRVCAVCCPHMYQRLNRPGIIAVYVVLIWLYSFALVAPTCFGVFGRYEFNSLTMECDMGKDKDSLRARKFAIFLHVLVPVASILIVYAVIFIKVVQREWRRRDRMRKRALILGKKVKMSSAKVARFSARSRTKASISCATASSVVADGAEASEGGPESEEGRKRSLRKMSSSSLKSLKKKVSDMNLKERLRDMRVALSIFIIFLVVIVCSVPVGTIHFIDARVTQPNRFLAVHILYWCQYCVNIVVYVFMNKQYREAYADCLARIFPWCSTCKTYRFPWEDKNTSTQGPVVNGSFRNKGKPSRPKEGEPLNPPGEEAPSRLPAILEASASASGNDDVFTDGCPSQADKTSRPMAEVKNEGVDPNAYVKRETEDDGPVLSSSPSLSDRSDGLPAKLLPSTDRNETPGVKERWITQNGHTLSRTPSCENIV